MTHPNVYCRKANAIYRKLKNAKHFFITSSTPKGVFMLLKRIIILQFSVLPCWWEFLHRTGSLSGGAWCFFPSFFSLWGPLLYLYYSFSAKNPAIIVPASRHVSWDENNYPSILLISGLDFMKWTQIQMLLLLYRQTRVGALVGILYLDMAFALSHLYY